MLGALIGDTVGSVYEFNNIKTKDFPIISETSKPTDDSVMTLAVAEICQKGLAGNREAIVNTFKKWGKCFPDAGYGGKFFDWLFSKKTKPYNSCGNGSAMRVSPCGWYGKTEEEVKALAKAVTEVTHNHPEGMKGAEVTAMCIYYARIGKSKEFIRKYVEKYYRLDFDYKELVETCVHGAEICQVTVPQALFCFFISDSFEDCLRTTISIGGDCDTTAAISCAIAEAYYKSIPVEIEDASLARIREVLKKDRKDENIGADEIIDSFIAYKAVEQVTCEDVSAGSYMLCHGMETAGGTKFNWVNSRNSEAIRNYLRSLDCFADDGKFIMSIRKAGNIGEINKLLEKKARTEFFRIFRTPGDAIEYLRGRFNFDTVLFNGSLTEGVVFEKKK